MPVVRFLLLLPAPLWLACVFAVLAGRAQAHDSWFAPLPRADRGELQFLMGTGNQFPVHEIGIARENVERAGCGVSAGAERGSVRTVPLRGVADRPTALLMRSAQSVPPGAALSCWAQLRPLDITIDNATVEIYLTEVSALPAVRERWAALRARGVRWQENYTKFARIEQAAQAGPDVQAPASATPTLGLDLRLDSPLPLRAGDTLRAQLLRDGVPLAGLPLELRSDLSPVGLWRQTDAAGRFSLPLPFAAQWVLRGVDLRPAADKPDAWDSRFITLAFEVLRKP